MLIAVRHQLTTDESGIRWYAIMKDVLRELIRQRGPEGFSGPYEESLLNMYWVCEGLRALSFDEDTAIGEWQEREASISTDTTSVSLSQSQLATKGTEWHLARCIALLGRLNSRYAFAISLLYSCY